ncbi:penicillin-binding protein activator [Defluviimonas sp. WL0075]|uniref:Penicillin-binding protein activator n=1 Tax=Albidovulum sediminicola TaxID=2984331 RepID=A0ABT2Z2A7_9RHOB|nr:penicillin-binding protein activator [Defluviimonas sp. WL0075]MCV2865279.1 penicillin-binding protein activator [Defluviimonas sp. WL0075]
MFAVLKSARKPLAWLALSLLSLSACGPIPMGGGGLKPGKPVPVALLVPGGSGNAADDVLAQNLRQAAEMAAADLQGASVDLRVYNTAADPAGASSAAQTAVSEGAAIILGPVYAQSANAAGRAVASSGVNVLAFSNVTDIAGGNVFVLGQTYPNTADRLVRYAAAQGRNRIFVLHEQTPAGDTGRRAIESAIGRSPAAHAGTMSYEFSQQGIIGAAPGIVAQIKASGATAVFLTADSGGALQLLSQLLPENGLDTNAVKLIGLTRWDTSPANMTLSGLQGGWFALPDPAPASGFQSRFAAKYGSIPLPISGLAYDGIAAIGALARSGAPDALSGSALTQRAGFAGVNGVFRLRSDGTNERALAVAELRNGQIVIIDPAPRSFGGAGF